MKCFRILVLLPILAATLASAQNFLFRHADFAAGAEPVGAVTADFNGDGCLDVATMNQQAQTISILLGKSDGTFQPHVDYPAGIASQLVVGDFNGDGKLDLAAAGNMGTSVSVLLGNGDGTFQPFVPYPVPASLQIVTGDFNHDGKLDLATANQANTLSVLLGNGDGTFQTHLDTTTGVAPIGLVAGDFNNDGNLDLAIGFFASKSFVGVGVFLGNGNGKFQAPISFEGYDGTPTTIAAGDFNGDGNLDVALGDLTPTNSVVIYLGDGTGNFSLGAQLAFAAEGPASIAVGDVNQDGKLDLVVPASDPVNATLVSVYLGNGNGSFQNATTYAAGLGSATALLGDFNLDGKKDVAVVNSQCSSLGSCGSVGGTVSLLYGNGKGVFVPSSQYTTAAASGGITAADFNGDGKPDLAVTALSVSLNSVAIFLNTGNGTFSTPTNFTTGMNPGYTVSADFNGDGHIDLAIADACLNARCQTGAVSILLGKGDGTFSPQVAYAAGVGPAGIGVGDFNGDGFPDLAIANFSPHIKSTVTVLLNQGDGTFGAPKSYAVGVDPESVAVGDFNNDGKLDLAVANNNNEMQSTISLLLGNGDGTFQPASSINTGGDNATSVVAGDLNGDGILDLAVTNSLSQAPGVSVLLGKGDGTFQTPVLYPVPNSASNSAVITDMNGDGKADVVVGADQLTLVYLGNGDGTLQSPLSYLAQGALDTHPTLLAAADFNGDGAKDLAMVNLSTTMTVYLSEPEIALSANTLNFGTVKVGQRSKPKNVVLANHGTAPLAVSKIKKSGPFLDRSTCGKTLNAGQTCTISVVFAPTTTGSATGSIVVTDNALSGSQSINLSGTGQ